MCRICAEFSCHIQYNRSFIPTTAVIKPLVTPNPVSKILESTALANEDAAWIFLQSTSHCYVSHEIHSDRSTSIGRHRILFPTARSSPRSGSRTASRRRARRATCARSSMALRRTSCGVCFCPTAWCISATRVAGRLIGQLGSRYAVTTDMDAMVLVSAHYDSRGSFGSVRAPGGNDGGSGTTGLLAIARIIKQLGVMFRSTVTLSLSRRDCTARNAMHVRMVFVCLPGNEP